MRKLVGLIVTTVFALGFAGQADANDDGPNFSFGAAASYAYDLNGPAGAQNGPPLNSTSALAYSSMEQSNSFNIDMVQLGIDGQRGHLRYGATIDFGDLAKFAGDSLDGDVALQTAWIGYDADPVGFTVGRIPTPLGYEVLEPWGNSHISRSYNWQYMPVNHDALTVQGGSDMFEVMIGVANKFSVADDAINPIPANDQNSDKAFFGSGNAAVADALNLYVSGIITRDGFSGGGGKTDIAMVNFIASGNFGVGNADSLRYAFEFNGRADDPQGSLPAAGINRMWGFAGYFGGDIGPTALDLRFEYVDDGGIVFPTNPAGADGAKVWSITATGAWAFVEGVDFRVEYRYDQANDDIFVRGSSSDRGYQHVLQAQVVWFPEI